MNRLCKLTACAGVCALTLVTSAVAQTAASPLIVNVPFSFYVSDRLMPAGQYMIGRASITEPRLIAVRSTATPGGNIFYRPEFKVALSYPATYVAKVSSKPLPYRFVQFNKYGENRYFLSQIWADTDGPGVQLPKCRRERELITTFMLTKAAPNQVVIEALATR